MKIKFTVFLFIFELKFSTQKIQCFRQSRTTYFLLNAPTFHTFSKIFLRSSKRKKVETLFEIGREGYIFAIITLACRNHCKKLKSSPLASCVFMQAMNILIFCLYVFLQTGTGSTVNEMQNGEKLYTVFSSFTQSLKYMKKICKLQTSDS